MQAGKISGWESKQDTEDVMKLTEAKDGQKLIVTAISGEDIIVQALRFGLDTGATIHVAKNIAGGPVIIGRHQLEIAIGRDIASAIEVSLAGEP